MARPVTDLRRRTITLDTGRRSIDIPVAGDGRLRRAVTLDRSTIERAADGGDGPIGFKGHAAVFNTETRIGGARWGFIEVIAPGAFAKTIGEADVRMLLNHDPNYVLARNTNGTLRLSEDAVGLAVDADMNPTTYARDLALLLERGDVTQMSFAFEMITYEWSTRDDGTEVLTHREVALWDVSPVTYPAYTETDASLRADLLAVARANGFDAVDLGLLAERLADPDPALIVSLRALARGDQPPAIGDPTPAPATSERDQPAGESTGATNNSDGFSAMREHRFAELSRLLEGVST